MTIEDWSYIYEYSRKKLGVDSLDLDRMYDQEDYEAEIARVCVEARTNQMARLVVVVGAGLALLVVAAPRFVATWPPRPTVEKPAPDAGAVRRERPPPRPPGLRPRPRVRPPEEQQDPHQ